MKTIHNEEIQTPLTPKILIELYKKELRPLYERIIEKLSVFNEFFFNIKYLWTSYNKTINNIEQLDDLLNDENQLSQSLELIFHYRLFGFRKAGTEHFDEHIQLRFEMNTYWYGFTLMNQNDNQPFLKKLYHQTMSEDDKHFIEGILTAKIFDRVDWIVDYIASKKQPQ